MRYFYVSSLVNKNGKRLVGITDTSDNVEEFYTQEEVYNIVNDGINIFGVTEHAIELFGKTAISLVDLAKGTPLKIKLSKNLEPKQVLFLYYQPASERANSTFYFFDDSGVEGYFGLTAPYLSTKTEIIFNKNNPEEVSRLTSKLARRVH